jgi:hypothetical protein
MLRMVVIVRLLVFLAALAVGGAILLWQGGPGYKFLIAPKTILLVMGFTLLLGILTYQPKDLLREFKKIFVKSAPGNERIRKPILIQLAMYALISGILLALVQILDHIGAVGTQSAEKGMLSLRAPLTSLLYAVLMGMGLLIVAGLEAIPTSGSRDQKESAQAGIKHVFFGTCLLMVTVGILSVLLSGMILDEKKSETSDIAVSQTVKAESPEGGESIGQVHGLTLGEDMIWRVNMSQEPKSVAKDTPITSNTQFRNAESILVVAEEVNSTTEVPLRWELSLDSGKADPWLHQNP